jgi:hypothetical protein
MLLSDLELLEFSKKGFFPLPNEMEESYIERMASLKSLFFGYEELSKELSEADSDQWLNDDLVDHSLAPLKELGDIDLKHIKVWCSDKDLSFFHLAGLMEVTRKGGEHFPLIQIKTPFLNSKSYLGYSRDEVLQHEVLHFLRYGFESCYEEFFSYKISKSPLRRFVGPFFSSSNFAKYTVICSVLSLGVFSLMTYLDYYFLEFFYFLTSLVLFYFIGALWKFYLFNRLLRRLTKHFQSENKAFSFAFRLSNSYFSHFLHTCPGSWGLILEKDKSLYGRWLNQVYLDYFKGAGDDELHL